MCAVSQKLIHQKFHIKFVQTRVLLFGERGDPEDGQEEIKNQQFCESFFFLSLFYALLSQTNKFKNHFCHQIINNSRYT